MADELFNPVLTDNDVRRLEKAVDYQGLFNNEALVDAVIFAESSGRPEVVSETGNVGLMQVGKGALADWNKYNKADYTIEDMKDPTINRMVGEWYLNTRIPQMLEYHKKDATLENKLWAYHDGIGNLNKGYKSEKAKNYIAKIKAQLGVK